MLSEPSEILTERTGLIIWINDVKAAAKNLEKYGSVHFISKRLMYAVIYVYTHRAEETTRQLQRLPFVKKIEPSYRNEIRTEYNSNVPDKTRFYTL